MGQRIKEETLFSLLAMPSHLQKTMITMEVQGCATAEDIAKATKRARAVESAYLNQLTIMGFLHKERNGRHVFFRNKEGHGHSAVFKKFAQLPDKWRRLICEDLLTALEGRVAVFQRIK